jgi:hypothetical protein
MPFKLNLEQEYIELVQHNVKMFGEQANTQNSQSNKHSLFSFTLLEI